jgi:hypothetical protein
MSDELERLILVTFIVAPPLIYFAVLTGIARSMGLP